MASQEVVGYALAVGNEMSRWLPNFEDFFLSLARLIESSEEQLNSASCDTSEELVAMDIIEPVEGPTPWVSSVVVVPKQNDGIRLCVDMRRANEAIIRERYPIPTVDEVLQSLNQSTCSVNWI